MGKLVPPFTCMGGKFNIAKHIAPHVLAKADNNIYVEPMACGAAVLYEVHNHFDILVLGDKDEHIVNVYRVMADEEMCDRLVDMLHRTPYARAEFERATDILSSPMEESPSLLHAWAYIVFRRQSHGANNIRTTWTSTTKRNFPNTFHKAADHLHIYASIIRKTYIDNRDVFYIVQKYDSPRTTFYIDPPYIPDTRVDTRQYKHEFTTEDHERLAVLLATTQGHVVLSSYQHPIYDVLGWELVKINTRASSSPRGNARRTEALYIKPHT